MKNSVLFIGSYAPKDQNGIHVATTAGKTLHSLPGVANPSFLKLAHGHKTLYAVSETENGTVQAFAVAPDGALSPAGIPQPTGNGPCHLSVAPGNHHLIAANYGGGSLAVFPLAADGSVRPAVQRLHFSGKGPNAARQEAPHAHSTIFSPDGRQVFAADLGTDRIYIYDYDPRHDKRPLSPARQPFATAAAGGGPRHMAFSANGKRLFVMLELTGQVQIFDYDGGTLTPRETLPATAPDYKGSNPSGADIHLSPDGMFLYASLRGDAHQIAIFRVTDSGLQHLSNFQLPGQEPRNFCLSADGTQLFCGLQKSNQIVVLQRNPDNGTLTDTGHRIEVSKPVCLEPMP